jgi:hypothetical protein
VNTTINVRKVVPSDGKPFSTYVCLGTRTCDMLERWVGVVVSWIESREVERALAQGEDVQIEVPARSWFYILAQR